MTIVCKAGEVAVLHSLVGGSERISSGITCFLPHPASPTKTAAPSPPAPANPRRSRAIQRLHQETTGIDTCTFFVAFCGPRLRFKIAFFTDSSSAENGTPFRIRSWVHSGLSASGASAFDIRILLISARFVETLTFFRRKISLTMETTISSKGQVVLPAAFRRKLDLREGDAIDARVDGGSIVLTPRRKPSGKARIVADPLTGLPALKAPDGAPVLRSKDVRDMLADFP